MSDTRAGEPIGGLDAVGRSVRLFVSSTFRDLQAERDVLVRRVFPQVRRLCESRDASWDEVDLRWGLPEDEATEERILPLCLQEIDACRPFFVGLIGDRYGWVPPQLPPGADERWPHLLPLRGRSITELEIEHGAFHPGMPPADALFYVRRPLARSKAARTDPLQALCGRLRASGYPVRDFVGPQDLEELVLRDLIALVDRRFPADLVPTPEDREDEPHRSWARRQCEVFVGSTASFRRLEAHLGSDGPPLVIVGPPGSGKSALLAAWMRWRAGETSRGWSLRRGLLDRLSGRRLRPPGLPVKTSVAHYVEAAPEAHQWPSLVLRVLRLAGDPHAAAPMSARTDVRTALASELCRPSPAGGRTLLVLDGLDHLEDRDGALELGWLPSRLPPHVRLIVSASGGRTLEVLRSRGWVCWSLRPLPPNDRAGLLTRVLGRAGKHLSARLLAQLVRAPASGRPDYLTLVAEELRVFGNRERLGEVVDACRTASSAEALYNDVLGRLERDHEGPRSGLVGDLLRLFLVSREGLREADLRELLGPPGSALPAAAWSPLRAVLGSSLRDVGGRLSIGRAALWRAAVDRYGATDLLDAARRRILAHLRGSARPWREIAEVPWQLAHLRDWDALADLLGNPSYLASAWCERPAEVRLYASLTEKATGRSLVERLTAVSAGQSSEVEEAVATLLFERGALEQAALRARSLLSRLEAAPAPPRLRALGLLANVAWRQGDLARAEEGFRRLRADAEAADDPGQVVRTLGDLALLLRDRGRPEKAAELATEEAALAERLGDPVARASALRHRAALALDHGEDEQARVCFAEAETLAREVGDLAGRRAALGGLGLLALRGGRLDEAGRHFDLEEQLCVSLGDEAARVACLGNQAAVLQRLARYDEALERIEVMEVASRSSGAPAGVVRALGMRAVLVARDMGHPHLALGDLQEALRVAREHGLSRQVADLEGLRAGILGEPEP